MNGYILEFGELLLAMKQALLAESALPYLNDCRIYNGPWIARPYNKHTVYLRPLGSPEMVDAHDGAMGVLKHAVHTVAVELVMLIDNPVDEDAVIGRTDAKVGITEFVSDVAGLLENNLLGIDSAKIEHGVGPTIEFPEGSYGVVQVEEDVWFQSARGIYRAQTRAFYRSGTYS